MNTDTTDSGDLLAKLSRLTEEAGRLRDQHMALVSALELGISRIEDQMRGLGFSEAAIMEAFEQESDLVIMAAALREATEGDI